MGCEFHKFLWRTAGAPGFPEAPYRTYLVFNETNETMEWNYLVTRILEVKPVDFLNTFL